MQVVAPASTSARRVKLTLSGAVGIERFQVSEQLNFSHPSGVSVSVNSGTVDVICKNNPGAPYSIPATRKQIRVLAAVYASQDASGSIMGVSNYETPLWFDRLMFRGGYDGVYTGNSYADLIRQGTNGCVQIVGATYPKSLRISLEAQRRFLDGPVDLTQLILDAIQADNPAWLADNGPFDKYVFASSEAYSLHRGFYTPLGNNGILYDLPAGKEVAFSAGQVEVRASRDAMTVVPKYNTSECRGVWLASDTLRIGTNYFTGGSVSWVSGSNYLTLGTPLPAANTPVQIEYVVDGVYSLNYFTQPDVWYPSDSLIKDLWHETTHAFGFQMTMSAKQGIGDAYFTPSRVSSYDIMSNSPQSRPHPSGGSMGECCFFHATNKYLLGYVNPYIPKGSEAGIALARSEFSGPAPQGCTMVKVPLRAAGEASVVTLSRTSFSSSYDPTNVTVFEGEEFLLIERHTFAPLPNGNHSFSNGGEGEGVLIYHVIDTGTKGLSLHADTPNILLGRAPEVLPYGAQSPVVPFMAGDTLKLQEIWQEKVTASDTHSFDFILSAGSGNKTLYIRGAAADGSGLVTTQVVINLSDGTIPVPPPTPTPTPTISAPWGITIAAVKNFDITLTWYAPITGASLVKQYAVRRGDGVVYTSIGTRFTDTHCQNNRTYSYYVVALDAAGMASPPSKTVSATAVKK